MYLLRFLQAASAKAIDKGERSVAVEYRLACSGELYRRDVETFDWRKSDLTRILLTTPIELFVASQPFNDYPQELCARFVTDFVSESETIDNISASTSFPPDEDIVEDLCSLLSLLSRRLISPSSKTRERHTPAPSGLASYGTDSPLPTFTIRPATQWAQRPFTVVTSVDGQRLIDNNPPPVGVSPRILGDCLKALPTIPDAEVLLYASRLYRAALELIESRPDIAYQLLISVAESFSAVALRDFEPDEDEKVERHKGVLKRALRSGLEPSQARELALAACRGEKWIKRRFVKFLLKGIEPSQLQAVDRVFQVPEHMVPSTDELETTLRKVYDARSANLHEGSPFPRSISIGTSVHVCTRNLPIHPRQKPEIPPVAWFERVVSDAARKYFVSLLPSKTEPFVDHL